MDIRNLCLIQTAYDYLLWWQYHHSQSLWAQYMRAKYGRRATVYAHIYDSATWKRICRVHPQMLLRVELTPDSPYWPSDLAGQCTLKSSYNLLVDNTATLEFPKHIWWSTLPLGGRVFLWKLWQHSLPLPDNLSSWESIFPTQCVFCRLHSDTQDHIFLCCPMIRTLWQEVSIVFSGPMPRQSSIRTYLLRWWHTSSLHDMIGQLQAVVPSLITLIIWKEYSSISFGQSSFSYSQLSERIRDHIHTWCSTTQRSKFTQPIPHLIERNFSPRL